MDYALAIVQQAQTQTAAKQKECAGYKEKDAHSRFAVLQLQQLFLTPLHHLEVHQGVQEVLQVHQVHQAVQQIKQPQQHYQSQEQTQQQPPQQQL